MVRSSGSTRSTVKAGDVSGLRPLAEACGDSFAFGLVLYDGADVMPFGDRLAAAPMSALWAGEPMTNGSQGEIAAKKEEG